MDDEFHRFAGQQVFLVHLRPECSAVLENVVDTGEIIAADAEGQGDNLLIPCVRVHALASHEA